jgi:hypothetical protein
MKVKYKTISSVLVPGNITKPLPDFRLPPRNGLKLCSSGYYAAGSGNLLPMFRDNLQPQSSTVKTLKTGPIRCPETSARNYHYPLWRRDRQVVPKRRKEITATRSWRGADRWSRNVSQKLPLPALEEGTDRLSRNAGKKFPLLTA